MPVTSANSDLNAVEYAAAQEWMRGLVRGWWDAPTLGLYAKRRTDPGIAYAAYELPLGGAPTTRGQEYVAACLAVRLYDRHDWRSADLPTAVLKLVDRMGEDIDLVEGALLSGRSEAAFLEFDDTAQRFVLALDAAMEKLILKAPLKAVESQAASVGGHRRVLSFTPAAAWRFQAAVASRSRLQVTERVRVMLDTAVVRCPPPPGVDLTPRNGVVVVDDGETWRMRFSYDQTIVDALRSLGREAARFDPGSKEWVVEKSATPMLRSKLPEKAVEALDKVDQGRAIGPGR